MKITEQSLETLSKFDLTINEGTLTFNVKGDILVLKPIVDGGKVTYDMEYLDKKTNRKIQQYQEKISELKGLNLLENADTTDKEPEQTDEEEQIVSDDEVATAPTEQEQ